MFVIKKTAIICFNKIYSVCYVLFIFFVCVSTEQFLHMLPDSRTPTFPQESYL